MSVKSKPPINLFAILRILIGLIFIVSSSQKLIGPYQNFLYVVQSYSLLPSFLEEFVARIMPWVELFVGIFLLLGLWLKWSLRATVGLFMTFIFVISQALIRQLPITECGCFGEKFSVPPTSMLMIDIIWLAITFLLIRRYDKTSALSLDRLYND